MIFIHFVSRKKFKITYRKKFKEKTNNNRKNYFCYNVIRLFPLIMAPNYTFSAVRAKVLKYYYLRNIKMQFLNITVK